jgi:hypothetical protein
MAEVTENPRQKQSSIDCLDVEWPVIRQGLFACPFNGYQVKSACRPWPSKLGCMEQRRCGNESV